MGLGDSDSVDDPFEIDHSDDFEPTERTKYCSVCGTTTTVTNGEVKYCGSCGRNLEHSTWNRLGSGMGDRNDDGDIGI